MSSCLTDHLSRCLLKALQFSLLGYEQLKRGKTLVPKVPNALHFMQLGQGSWWQGMGWWIKTVRPEEICASMFIFTWVSPIQHETCVLMIWSLPRICFVFFCAFKKTLGDMQVKYAYCNNCMKAHEIGGLSSSVHSRQGESIPAPAYWNWNPTLTGKLSSRGPCCTSAHSVVRINDFRFRHHWCSSPSVRAFALLVSALSLGVKVNALGFNFGATSSDGMMKAFVEGEDCFQWFLRVHLIMLYFHVGGSFAFSILFVHQIWFLTYPELSEFCFWGHGFVFRVFTLSSLTVLCFAPIHSLHKVHLAHNDGHSCLNAGLYKGCHAVSQLVYTVYIYIYTMMIYDDTIMLE